MADMQTALRARLLASPAVAAKTTRIYWTKAKDAAALPYIRMQTISDQRPLDLEGYETARETRVQVDCFAEVYAAARALAEAVIAATDGPATVDGVVFGRTAVEGPRDLGDDANGKFIHQLSMDLLIWHRLA